LLIPYDDAAHLRAIDEGLFGLGFGRQRSRDPFPEERPLRIGAVDWEGERVPLHVHVVPAPSPEIAALIGFRDRLRTDPALLEAYVRNKRAIPAAGSADGASYAEAQGSFIRAALGGTGARRPDASGFDESGVPSRGHFTAEPPAPSSPDAPASNASGRHDARGTR
ncbi:MAG TPA: GrpB family protein, partial [Thermomicrobiales bacterium]|nr:GrpB family protein [Thermomicrobiales bacterium]